MVTHLDPRYTALVLSKRMAESVQVSAGDSGPRCSHALHSEIDIPKRVDPAPSQVQLGMDGLTKADFSLTDGDFVESTTCLIRRTSSGRSSGSPYLNSPHNPKPHMERYTLRGCPEIPSTFPPSQ